MDEVKEIDSIPVTSVTRTLFDLSGVLDRVGLERAMNEAEVRGLTDPLSLADLLERYPRRRGAATLREIAKAETVADGVTRNELEQAFAAVIETSSLPRPRFNADLALSGRFISVDCLWEEQRLIVELDGRAVHGTRLAFEADRERDRLLMVEGWRVMRVTWAQLRDDRAAIASDLRRLLAA